MATNKLRLPLSATAGCFAPLFETDVARAVAAITAQPSRPEFAGVVFNLTGPTSFTGDELAAVAANSTGNHRITFADITPAATATVLDAAGANLTQSEIRLIVGLVTLQTTGCGRFPSPDLTKLTGAPGTEISVFFAANKIAFGGCPRPTPPPHPTTTTTTPVSAAPAANAQRSVTCWGALVFPFRLQTNAPRLNYAGVFGKSEVYFTMSRTSTCEAQAAGALTCLSLLNGVTA